MFWETGVKKMAERILKIIAFTEVNIFEKQKASSCKYFLSRFLSIIFINLRKL
jgi:hypothetical protein